MTSTLTPEASTSEATTLPARSSAAIAQDLEQRRARRATISAQFQATRRDLAQLRAERARALADGSSSSNAGKASRLAEEEDGLAQALELLDGDIAALEAEAAEGAIVDAAAAERDAIAEAVRLADELEALVGQVATRDLLPLGDRVRAAIATARAKERVHESLMRKANRELPSLRPGQALELRSKPALLPLDAALRAFVDGKRLPNPYAGGFREPSAPTEPVDKGAAFK